MNIWIHAYGTHQHPEWTRSKPPVDLQMLLPQLGAKGNAPSLILTKEIDGSCQIIMQVPGKEGCVIAINEFTETQARAFVASCLKQHAALEQLANAIDTTDEVYSVNWTAAEQAVTELTNATEVDKDAQPMFPEWVRENYRTTPDCFNMVAECLKARRFSAGSGTKIIIADHAVFTDSDRADIILSATATGKRQASNTALPGAGILMVGVGALAVLSAAATGRRQASFTALPGVGILKVGALAALVGIATGTLMVGIATGTLIKLNSARKKRARIKTDRLEREYK